VSQTVSGSTNNPTETTNLDIIPQVNLGLQWQIIPNRLAFNAGLKLNVLDFSRYETIYKPAGIETTTTYDAVGNVTNITSSNTSSYTDIQYVSSELKLFSGASLPIGLTVNVTDNFTLDALTQFNISGGDLTNISSLLFTVTF
jgi:hypothetical protein